MAERVMAFSCITSTGIQLLLSWETYMSAFGPSGNARVKTIARSPPPYSKEMYNLSDADIFTLI